MGQRFLLSICFSVVFAGAVYAQQGFEMGTTTTLNGSFIIHGQNLFQTLNGTGIPPQSRLAYRFTFGYNVGLAFGYNFNNKYGIYTAVSYNKGGEHYDDIFNPYGSGPLHIIRTVDLSYIQVPVFFKYDFVCFKERYRLYAMTGPEFGFMVNAQENISTNGAPNQVILTAGQEYKKFDLGWGLGLGTDIYIRQDLYFEGGLFGYVGLLDMNTSAVKAQPWFAANDVKYQTSYNFHPGVELGIHFLFNKEAHNPFSKKKEAPILPARKGKESKGGE